MIFNQSGRHVSYLEFSLSRQSLARRLFNQGWTILVLLGADGLSKVLSHCSVKITFLAGHFEFGFFKFDNF